MVTSSSGDSEKQLQPQLNLPGITNRPADHTEQRTRYCGLRQIERRMIEKVERFGAKLHLDSLCEPVLPEQRKVDVLQRIPTQNIATRAAESILRRRLEGSF